MTLLYRFYDAVGVLLYVGITSAGLLRWQAHAREKGWWVEVASVTVEHFADRTDAIEAERRAIEVEKPTHNVIGSGLRSPVSEPINRKWNTGTLFYRADRDRWQALTPNRLGRRFLYFKTREQGEAFLAAIAALQDPEVRSAVEVVQAELDARETVA